MLSKRIALGAVLALAACGLVAHGLERNIQEVLEERFTQVSNATQESGGLPLIVGTDLLESRNAPGGEARTATEVDDAGSAPEQSAARCTCEQEEAASREPKSKATAKAGKKLKVEKVEKLKKNKGDKLEPIVEAESAEFSAEDSEQAVEARETAAAAAETPDEKVADESKLAQDEGKQKQRNGKKVKKEKDAGKRAKRDTKGGKNKSKSKGKGKRSAEGKFKEAGKNKDKSKRNNDKNRK